MMTIKCSYWSAEKSDSPTGLPKMENKLPIEVWSSARIAYVQYKVVIAGNSLGRMILNDLCEK